MRFDLKDLIITGAQDSAISGQDLFVMVNNEEINNPKYGSITNPIHVFSYKGVKKQIEVNKENGKDKMIWISLEPTQKEYENNVIQYLTYVMSGREFKEKFERGTSGMSYIFIAVAIIIALIIFYLSCCYKPDKAEQERINNYLTNAAGDIINKHTILYEQEHKEDDNCEKTNL